MARAWRRGKDSFNAKTLIKLCRSIRNSHRLENLIHLFLEFLNRYFSVWFILIVSLGFLINVVEVQWWNLIGLLSNQRRATRNRNKWIITIEGKLSERSIMHSWIWWRRSLFEFLRWGWLHWSSRKMLGTLRYFSKVKANEGSWTILISLADAIVFLKEYFLILKKNGDHHFFNFFFVNLLCLYFFNIKFV